VYKAPVREKESASYQACEQVHTEVVNWETCREPWEAPETVEIPSTPCHCHTTPSLSTVYMAQCTADVINVHENRYKRSFMKIQK